mgnify:CR=1 FL=1|tara:strand:+ start:13949 stop:14905 length:957 start_codon:yes stop_codon:yes gene_type:complete
MIRILLVFFSLLVITCNKEDSNYSEAFDNSFYKGVLNDSFVFYEGQASYSINHNGLKREYVMYIPPNIESRENLPVIFNFHGYQGQANNFFNWSGLVKIADQNGVILVYPQGSPLDGGPSHWNAAPLNSSSPSFVNKSNVNDLDFFLKLFDEVNQNNIIDLDRVYAIGYSNGGMFSHYLACNTDNIFAAIGDVAGTILSDTYNNCNPSNPIPILKIHGTNDNVVGYNGFLNGGFKSVDEVINFWKLNNSSNENVIFEDLGEKSGFNVVFEKYTYESDINSSEIVHYKMVRGGHWWDYSDDENFMTSSLLWDFFSKHSR